MNIEQERAEFEVWYAAPNNNGTAWEAWQARAALHSRDREDAERYRWLRKHWFTMTSCYDGGRVEFTTGQPRYSNATEANVDEAIDHARRIKGEGE